MSQSEDNLGLRCPHCGCRHCPEDPMRVKQTFSLSINQSVRRRRQCRYCQRTFFTREQAEKKFPNTGMSSSGL